MGLDNIPAVYPCRKAATAVEVAGEDGKRRIDCDLTQTAGGCPWQGALPRDRGIPVTGMFGIDCWYRGKVGSRLVAELMIHDIALPPAIAGDFYGIEGADPNLSPDYCRALSIWMADHAETFARVVEIPDPEEYRAVLERYRYATWWLGWIADAGDGANAWW
jgi:hypothetical protein